METLTKNYVKDWTDDSLWIINTPSSFARDTLFYVQEIGHFFCRTSYYTEHEGIRSFLVLLTLAGEGRMHLHGTEYALRPGDAVFTDCMERHSYEPAGARPWQMLWLHFNGIAAPGYFEQFARHDSPRIPGPTRKIESILRALLAENEHRNASSELRSASLITELLTSILLNAHTVPQGERRPVFIDEAVKDIDAHVAENLSLDHFASTLGVSKYYFQREFKKHVGMSPCAYVRLARLRYAKTLLATTQLPVAEVAERSGFRSPAYFINTFRDATGTTPLHYRRSLPPGPGVQSPR